MFNMAEKLPDMLYTLRFFYFGTKCDGCENVPPEQLKISNVCVCVYFGMPTNAGSVADPLLPNINPESIHLFSKP